MEEDLKFLEDMEQELNRIIEGEEGQKEEDLNKKEEDNEESTKEGHQSFEEKYLSEDDSGEKETEESASLMTIFSSFASSATRRLSGSLPSSSEVKLAKKSLTDEKEDELVALAQTPEALEKLRQIQAEHNVKQKKLMYASILASNSSREISVSARSSTDIPFTVPPGKEISWKFQVKNYDIVFGVKLRVQDDASGEWMEHVLTPMDTLTSEDHISESCCAERCTRKFIFTLDNTSALFYSRTIAYDITMSDDKEIQNESFEDGIAHDMTSREGEEVAPDDSDSIMKTGEAPDIVEQKSGHGETAVKWTKHYSEDGTPYYYNCNTGESQWDQPDAPVVDQSDQSPGQLSPEKEGQENEDDDDDAMAALILKLTKGFKAGYITAAEREKFMADIIDCRDLSDVHEELNSLFDRNDRNSEDR